MGEKVSRVSVDLSGHPDLVVIYLGFRVQRLRGVLSLLRLGRGLADVQRHKPPGLLQHDFMLFGPLHPGFRQYWIDMEHLERFTRSEPHATWWHDFMKDTGGAGFWHESYLIRGGMEAIYLNMPPTGFARFAPTRTPQGPFMSARQRLQPQIAG